MLADVSVDPNTVKELDDAYSAGGGGGHNVHASESETVGNAPLSLTYRNRVQNIAVEENAIMTSLNRMMEERKECDQVPKDGLPLSKTETDMQGTSFVKPREAVRVIMLMVVAAAYCFGTTLVFGVVATVYAGLTSAEPKQKVGLVILLGVKLAVPFIVLRRL